MKIVITLFSITLPFIIGYIFQGLYFATSSGEIGLFSMTMEKPALIKIFLLGFFMIVGIFCSLLREAIAAAAEKINIKKIFSETLQRKETWSAFLVSPFIFYAVYVQAKSQPDTVIAIFTSFTNGFFWSNVFDTFKQKRK